MVRIDRRTIATLAVLAALLASCSHGEVSTRSGAPTTIATTEIRPTTTTSAPSPPTDTGPSIQGVDFLNDEHGYGLLIDQVGDACSLRVATTADGGSTFSAAVSVAQGSCQNGYQETRLVFDGAGDGFVYGPRLYVTHDSGTTWTDASPSGIVVAVVPFGTTVWRLVAHCEGSPETCSLSLDESSDGGRTWIPSKATLPKASTFGVLAPPGTSLLVRNSTSSAFLVVPTSPTAATILSTADGARTWKQSLVPCLGGWGEILSRAFDSSLWLACAGQPGAGSQLKSVVRSLDGGKSWIPGTPCPPDLTSTTYPPCAESNGLSGGYLSDIVGLSSTTAFIDGGRSFLQVTHDGGATWSLTKPLVGNGDLSVGGLSFVDPEHGWVIVGESNSAATLWRTTDGGNSWQQTYPN